MLTGVVSLDIRRLPSRVARARFVRAHDPGRDCHAGLGFVNSASLRSVADIAKRRAERWNFLFIAGMWLQDLFNYDFRRTEMCIPVCHAGRRNLAKL